MSILTGCQSDIKYNNPVVKQRADPWVLKVDNVYYYVATAPEYDRIEMRQSNTINGLSAAEARVIWRKYDKGVMGNNIWAPELHRIDGKWYIYFAAGETEKAWNIRMYALSNDSQDPMQGEWKEEGRILTAHDSFSLDATFFEHKGRKYYVWAQHVREGENTSLLISEMDSPIKLKGKEVVISNPEFDWERKGYSVNEGPAILKKNGKIFMTYSASATDDTYCVGLLWADENADLLDAESWNKSEEPVFFTNEEMNRFGPGHNSFTVSEDGTTDVMIYHARNYKRLRGSPLTDPNRHTRARVINWTMDGFPDFRQNEE
ncbi:glycoside hydrolase family 43 protein [Carboxylicivirga sp. N1Y90]|uniref:glycoside hydrolase family 43 protein n=1 Tax=Carboxylicivirga fragile TaxID=3417571 RepID=UPI003D33B487|nr:glycoside hydrolase family 43 protein [Marinilabiliaceae bacterium N1Y90]